MIGLLFFISVLFLSSCSDWEPVIEIVKTIDTGKVISSELIPGNISQWTKTMIKTECGNLLVYGTRSVIIGDNSEIRIYNNGKRYLCLESEADCFYIY